MSRALSTSSASSLRRFWVNVQNNFLWLFFFIVPTTLLGFVLAYLFHGLRRAEKVFRQIFLYPMALAFIVTGTLWAWMYDPGSGLINSILGGLGINTAKLGWIALPNIAIFCMIFSAFWQYVGFALVIYMGAATSIVILIIAAAMVIPYSKWAISKWVR